MWTVQLCEKILNSKKYIHLCEKRLCPLHGKQFYLNAFEFGVFASKKLCVKLSHAMHALGFLSSDMLTPFIVSLATVKLYTSNYYTLACIHWNKETVLGMLKRPDSDIILNCRNGLTGFEFALTDAELSKKVGKLIFKKDLSIYAIIPYKIFHSSNNYHIKLLFNL